MEKSFLLNGLAAQTEAQLQLAIQQWQMLPDAIFAKMPAADSWSANQCLQHLNSYSRYYLPQIEKAIAKAKKHPAPLHQSFNPGWLGGWFTRLMQPGNDEKPSKKMKAPANHSPAGILPSFEVLGEFIDHQEKLLRLLQEARRVNLAAVRIPISIAPFIKLKLGDVLAFVVAHNQRHVLQAMRAIAAAKHTSQAAA